MIVLVEVWFFIGVSVDFVDVLLDDLFFGIFCGDKMICIQDFSDVYFDLVE